MAWISKFEINIFLIKYLKQFDYDWAHHWTNLVDYDEYGYLSFDKIICDLKTFTIIDSVAQKQGKNIAIFK